MYGIGKEAAQLAPWTMRQRLTALKRIVPLKNVKAALRHAGRGQTYCFVPAHAMNSWCGS
jgi:hypothetical protein